MVCFRIIAWLMLLASTLWAPAGDVTVVVNVKNPVIRLTVSDLRKAFAGEKCRWLGGIPVKLIIRATGTRERETALHLLRLSNEDFNRYWIAQVYRGEAAGPVTVFSNGMQKEAVIYPRGDCADRSRRCEARNESLAGSRQASRTGRLPAALKTMIYPTSAPAAFRLVPKENCQRRGIRRRCDAISGRARRE